MHEYTARTHWQRLAGESFSDLRYHRRHDWRFDGGAVVAGSSSPLSVPIPHSDTAAIDPEEAFVAALSSCHLLWFLALAASAGWVVDDYCDDAVGEMAQDALGGLAITRVTLRPRVRFGGSARPDTEQHVTLHRQAHERCFIARSVTSELRCLPSLED
jgi:organic hydroperoxide reductase OsmC/OhrA